MDHNSMVDTAISQTLERFAAALTKGPEDRLTLEEATTETVRWLYRTNLRTVIRLMRELNRTSGFDGRDKIRPAQEIGGLLYDVASHLAMKIKRHYPLVAEATRPAASEVESILGEFEIHRALVVSSNQRLADAF